MACPKCNSKNIEKRIANTKPVLNYTCSGMHTRLNKVVVHKENHCRACGNTWK